MKVLVSNGCYRFHLAPLAVELSRRDLLQELLVAGWPIGWQKQLALFFKGNLAWDRFIDREEDLDPSFIYSFPNVEAILRLGNLFIRYSKSLSQVIQLASFSRFCKCADSRIKLLKPDIYHYRCAFGGRSVITARELGIPTLCDHSIAHPFLINFLIYNQGLLPPPPYIPDSLSMLEHAMSNDMALADYIIVNSDFVKQTCVHAGIPAHRIFVAYWGVDEKFFSTVTPFQSHYDNRPSILYAGTLEKRKGVLTLIKAISKLKSCPMIHVAGGISPILEGNSELISFLSKDLVKYHGIVARKQLSELMKESRIFVFPSYCEGSARVIFEAMASGCFIITTANSGSIVQNDVHGILVPPGDPDSLAFAIDYALSNPSLVRDIGMNNARLIESQFRQTHYADKVVQIYHQICGKR